MLPTAGSVQVSLGQAVPDAGWPWMFAQFLINGVGLGSRRSTWGGSMATVKTKVPWLVVAACAVVAGAAFLLLRGGGGKYPLAEALSARDTVGFVGIEGLDGLVRDFDRVGERFPAEVRAGLPAWLEPKQRAAVLGFDPATAAGWHSIGVDSERGVAVVLDARVRGANGLPAPLALARVDDRPAFAKWLGKRLGQPVDIGDKSDGVRVMGAGKEKIATAHVHGWSAAVMADGDLPESFLPGLKQFAAAEGPALAGDAAFRAALADAPSGARVLAWGGMDGARAVLKSQGLSVDKMAAFSHAAHLARGLAVYAGDEGGGARLVATADGVKALQQLMVPARKAPGFSSHIPAHGWSAMRMSINLKDVFDGAGALLPPSMGEVRAAIGAGRMFMPMAVGFAWEDVTRALSGHAVLAVASDSLRAALGGKSAPEWRLLLAVEDGAAADALLAKLAALAKRKGLQAEDITHKGGRGLSLEVGGVRGVIVHVGDLLVAAPTTAAIDSTTSLARGDSLAGTDAAATLDGDVVLGLTVDSHLAAAQAGTAPQPTAGGQVAMRLQVDTSGMLLAFSGGSEAARQLATMAIGIAQSSLTSYLAKSKALPAPNAAE